MPATLPGFRYHGPSPQPAERDPADDHAFAPRSTEGLCRCGVTLYDSNHVTCELCRHAVQDEGDL
jgi:hypothetical protein